MIAGQAALVDTPPAMKSSELGADKRPSLPQLCNARLGLSAGCQHLRQLGSEGRSSLAAPSDPHQAGPWQSLRGGDGRSQLCRRGTDSHGDLPNW